MREVTRHGPGRIFLAVLLASLLFLVFVAPFLYTDKLFLGWMSGPFLFGAIVVIIWGIALAIYTFRYWPYR